MPVRIVRNGPPGKIIIRIAGRKSMPPAIAESPLEFDYSVLLETDPAVVSYETQPLKVQYFFDGRIRTYTPDFLVRYVGHKELVEVKPEAIASTERFQRWRAAVTPSIEELGYAFCVVTSAEIRQEPRLSSRTLLLRYLDDQFEESHLDRLAGLLRNGRRTLGNARAWCHQNGISVGSVFHLMAIGAIEFDDSQSINDQLILGGVHHA